MKEDENDILAWLADMFGDLARCDGGGGAESVTVKGLRRQVDAHVAGDGGGDGEITNSHRVVSGVEPLLAHYRYGSVCIGVWRSSDTCPI